MKSKDLDDSDVKSYRRGIYLHESVNEEIYGGDFVNYYRYVFKGSAENRREAWEKLRYSLAKVLGKLHNKAGVVLDVGCGFGLQSILFSEAGFRAIAIDEHRERMKTTTKQLIKTFGQDCNPIVADALNLPIRPSSIDIAFAREVISHVRNLTQTLKEMSLALRTGGEAVIEDGDRSSIVLNLYVLVKRGRKYRPSVKYGQYAERMFSPKEIQYMLREYGFASTKKFYSLSNSGFGTLLNLRLLRFIDRNLHFLLSFPVIENILGSYIIIAEKEHRNEIDSGTRSVS